MVSIIIPVYNEEKTIADCLTSLFTQTYKKLEIIVIDDGSRDNSKSKIEEIQSHTPTPNIKLISQQHLGPAQARNTGVKLAKGEIIVFVDADMVFDKNFIKDLVTPIEQGESIGTFSKEEYLLNSKNIWSLCWNINRYILNKWKLDSDVSKRILPSYYPNMQPVFRAILIKEFEKVGGFDNIGYTDDWTLSRKLKTPATVTQGAIYYHRNPESLRESWHQAKWIGRNEFISGTFIRKLFNLFRYSIISSVIIGFFVTLRTKTPHFIIFKLVYDASISSAIFDSFFQKDLNKK